MGFIFLSRFNILSTFILEKSDLIILLFCAAVVLAIDKLYHSSFIQTYKKAVNEYENTPYWSPKIGFVLEAVSTFIFCIAVLSTVYFSNRMYYMLGQHGVDVTQHIHRDILHLQVQFLTAMLALNFILLILILMVYRYMKFREYSGELDFLTGIMGRKLFLHLSHSQKSHAGAAEAGFWSAIWIISSTSTINTVILSVMRSLNSCRAFTEHLSFLQLCRPYRR